MTWSSVALFLIGVASTGAYVLTHFEDMDKWWHNFIFNQFEKHYLVFRLQIGGHCGCCGAWVSDKILPKYWAITLCKECLRPSAQQRKRRENNE